MWWWGALSRACGTRLCLPHSTAGWARRGGAESLARRWGGVVALETEEPVGVCVGMAWVQDTHHHVRSAVCRTAAVVTADRDGPLWCRFLLVATLEGCGGSRDATDTGPAAGRVSEGWVWYELSNGVKQLEDLADMSTDEINELQAEQAMRAASKLRSVCASSASGVGGVHK